MYTRESLRAFFGVEERFAFQPPNLATLRWAAAELGRRHAATDGANVSEGLVERAHRAASSAVSQGLSLRTLKGAESRWLPLAIFYPAGKPALWLAANERIVKEYLKLVEERKDVAGIRRLLRAFVINYQPELSTFEILRTGIGQIVAGIVSPRLADRKEWALRNHLLERGGPSLFVSGWEQTPSVLHERLADLGGDGELSASQFVAEAETALVASLKTIGPKLSEAQFTAVVDALSLRAAEQPSFRDPARGAALVDAVLGLFTTRPPAARLQATIRKAVVDRMGDPRLPGHGRAWVSVSRRSTDVMCRWLVNETLKVFFDIISESLTDNPEQRLQWEARKVFWNGYLEHIGDAWVALSPAASQLAAGHPSFAGIPHGRMLGASGNSVLILRIDTLRLVEFSHLGGVRYWPVGAQTSEGDEAGPEPYQDEYRLPSSFVVSRLQNIPHSSGWQAAVRKVIREHTGILP